MNAKNHMLFCAAIAALALSTNVQANEVVMSDGASKSGGTRLALDFVNSGNATAFQFQVEVPKGARVNTSSCVVEVPSSHTGACRFDKSTGAVTVMVYSNSNASLPTGVVPVGWLDVAGAQRGEFKVVNPLVAGADAESLSVRAIDGSSPGRARGERSQESGSRVK